MLGDELDRPTPVRSFHPARDFLRRTGVREPRR